jgi:DNA primase
LSDDLKQAIEQVKLRTPIEDLVRERVAGLKKAGVLWQACCPFHEERTPSFKVDPRRGTWRCYGACGQGGDAISFLERMDNLSFFEALEVLAARAGVELPKTRRPGQSAAAKDAQARLYEVLERATEFYRRHLHQRDGAPALDYLRRRGLTPTTIEAFGLGYAPEQGDLLVAKARGSDIPLDALLATGLARRRDSGVPYDFFRGRLMVPIRDLKGRTVGFGARRLADGDPTVPKYINTQETELFHKGQLVYALDIALEHVRRSGHLVLVEGYTDVMAAHQVGLRTVAAVLGTQTTDEHAALVRRTGAKRVTLCFDGDEAGTRATFRALQGLLPLGVKIDVVRLALAAGSDSGASAIKDPCDFLIRHGAAAFAAELERAQDWFEFLLGGVAGLRGEELGAQSDRVLELLGRIPEGVHRESRLAELADALRVPAEGVRRQFESLPERARERRRRERELAAPATEKRETEPDPLLDRAWQEIAAASLLEASFLPRVRGALGECAREDLRSLLEELCALEARHGALPGVDGIFTALADHPARGRITQLLQLADQAESLHALFEGAWATLERRRREREIRAESERAVRSGDEEEQRRRLAWLHQELRRRVTPAPAPVSAALAPTQTEHLLEPRPLAVEGSFLADGERRSSSLTQERAAALDSVTEGS